jgi:hypothetical protein
LRAKTERQHIHDKQKGENSRQEKNRKKERRTELQKGEKCRGDSSRRERSAGRRGKQEGEEGEGGRGGYQLSKSCSQQDPVLIRKDENGLERTDRKEKGLNGKDWTERIRRKVWMKREPSMPVEREERERERGGRIHMQRLSQGPSASRKGTTPPKSIQFNPVQFIKQAPPIII